MRDLAQDLHKEIRFTGPDGKIRLVPQWVFVIYEQAKKPTMQSNIQRLLKISLVYFAGFSTGYIAISYYVVFGAILTYIAVDILFYYIIKYAPAIWKKRKKS